MIAPKPRPKRSLQIDNVNSAGNSLPSQRLAVTSIVRPAIREGSLRTMRAKPAAWLARNRSGTTTSMFWPSIAPGPYPKSASAASFTKVIRPLLSLVMKA
ncbi:hypothetical protein AFCDBAGC_0235 [Methylobacterium cerastii]|uniref:Uncharacterized protein n=1 Tax=Methylobacterium cerastii TaxID=932741 RepID=A0ABQ4QBD7_9HYPH|nr:hypothetical protein AFCDBAGC_0235 [Methylobacterium cerastii]